MQIFCIALENFCKSRCHPVNELINQDLARDNFFRATLNFFREKNTPKIRPIRPPVTKKESKYR